MSMQTTPNKSAHRARTVDLKSHGRSRVSNGKDILPNLRDGRSVIARRYRDIASAILSDQGGIDQCSESRTQLARRFAAAACMAEIMESRLANGEEISIQEHALLVSSMVRVARQIGVNRLPKILNASNSPELAAYEQALAEIDEEAEVR
jgi:hypothetical protein